jgi:hypothetical protein
VPQPTCVLGKPSKCYILLRGTPVEASRLPTLFSKHQKLVLRLACGTKATRPLLGMSRVGRKHKHKRLQLHTTRATKWCANVNRTVRPNWYIDMRINRK